MPDADDVIDPFLAFADVALRTTAERMPEVDQAAMAMVLLLHRVTNTVVYDLESTVHRPAGWSWSAFRLLFTLWVAGPQEASRAAELSGMSRAAVSSLSKTLNARRPAWPAPPARGTARRGALADRGGHEPARGDLPGAQPARGRVGRSCSPRTSSRCFNTVLTKLVRAARPRTGSATAF